MPPNIVLLTLACLLASTYCTPTSNHNEHKPRDGIFPPPTRRDSLLARGLLVPGIKSFINAVPRQEKPAQGDFLLKRNTLIPSYLIPTSPVNPATWTVGSQVVSEERVLATPITLVTSTLPAKRDVTAMPNLVPTSEVNLATDTTGTRTISPLLVPTKIVTIGSATTSGCSVTLSDSSYVTYCSGANATPAPMGVLELAASGVADCCGGQDDLHACTEDGSLPVGPEEWKCKLGTTTYVGVTTATATLS
ncbi:hypothetical protein LTR62_004675 [Meristemomyces frigidus]|uniref:Uncharacterized protein n=1 Tax=Meristemomyces frigidus TaxID=1508187 RepID=A0AAN7TGF0_9PEZI|nr:hypothetical protein LTR62_004675 [Meristemomyces frigidus]